LASDWSQPLDLAVLYEDAILYFACVYPSAITTIDWAFAVPIIQTVVEHARQLQPPDSPDLIPDDWMSKLDFRMEVKNVSEIAGGLTLYRIKLSLSDEEKGFSFVYAQDSGIIYAAIPFQDDSDGISEELYETMQQRLEEKIDISKQAAAEKMKPPTTLFRSNFDGNNMSVNYETTEHGSRIIAYIAQDSLDKAFALAKTFGIVPTGLVP